MGLELGLRFGVWAIGGNLCSCISTDVSDAGVVGLLVSDIILGYLITA